jgi:endonuclease III
VAIFAPRLERFYFLVQAMKAKKIRLQYEDLCAACVLDGREAAHVKPESPKMMDAPNNWEIVYDLLKEYRSTHVAPVDVMGCSELSLPESSPLERRFHCLVGLLLSSQTKDVHTSAAMMRLHQHVRPDTLNATTLTRIPVEALERLLIPVSFYRKKALGLQRVSRILIDKYQGDIPDTLEGLLDLPGVGPKMVRKGLARICHYQCPTTRLIFVSIPRGTKQAALAWTCMSIVLLDGWAG